MHKFKNWIETNKSTIQNSNVYDLIDRIINNKSVGGLSLVDIAAFALSIAYLKNEFDQFYFEVIADKTIILNLAAHVDNIEITLSASLVEYAA